MNLKAKISSGQFFSAALIKVYIRAHIFADL